MCDYLLMLNCNLHECYISVRIGKCECMQNEIFEVDSQGYNFLAIDTLHFLQHTELALMK